MWAKRGKGDFNFVEAGLKAGAVAGSELGQCGAVLAWEQDLRWVDVGGMCVEDRVRV